MSNMIGMNVNPRVQIIDSDDVISEISDSQEYVEVVEAVSTLLERLILGYFDEIELDEDEVNEILQDVMDGVTQQLKDDLG